MDRKQAEIKKNQIIYTIMKSDNEYYIRIIDRLNPDEARDRVCKLEDIINVAEPYINNYNIQATKNRQKTVNKDEMTITDAIMVLENLFFEVEVIKNLPNDINADEIALEDEIFFLLEQEIDNLSYLSVKIDEIKAKMPKTIKRLVNSMIFDTKNCMKALNQQQIM